jgi:pimeloyl-ACP methyl ester carboxylesterase
MKPSLWHCADFDRPGVPMPPITDVRTARVTKVIETKASTQPEVQAPAAQADWTKTIVDPTKQQAARSRHAGEVANPSAASMRTQNERAEMDLIGGSNKPGVLVGQGGDARRGTTITIHGINDNPASVMPLSGTGKQAKATFAWDDKSRRLDDSANDFANEMKSVLAKNPKAPLTINAYSMGGRVAAVGMARLEQTGALKGRDVKLNLIAPPLQGFGSANMAGMGAGLVKSLRSSVDMGTRSDFQKELEGIRFQSVKVHIMGGGADTTAVADDSWKAIARQLSGREPTILSGADHDGAVAAAAKLLK